MSAKPKLFELIPIIEDRDTDAKKVLEETAHAFKNQRNIFVGAVKRTVAFDDSRAQALNGEERVERATTVPERLMYTLDRMTPDIDVNAAVDRTNALAKADIVLDDGTVIMKDVPVATLLGLERRLKALRAVLVETPTLPQGISWVPDSSAGKFVWVTAHPSVVKKTEKIMTPVELSPATKEHKAQVKENVQDVPVADIIETKYNGMITPQDLSEMLTRLTNLQTAVKKARQRANDIPVEDLKVGAALKDYLLGPWIK